MREHMQARHLGIKHPCPHCGKNFNHKFSLTKHIRDKKCPGLSSKESVNNIVPDASTINQQQMPLIMTPIAQQQQQMLSVPSLLPSISHVHPQVPINQDMSQEQQQILANPTTGHELPAA